MSHVQMEDNQKLVYKRIFDHSYKIVHEKKYQSMKTTYSGKHNQHCENDRTWKCYGDSTY